MHRILSVATGREWQPRLMELNVMEGQYGAGVPREVEPS